MVKRWFVLSALITMMVMLTACLYPEERRAENMGPVDVHIQAVQDALNRYRQDTGVLPIYNSELNTPIYEKYVIDFSKLLPRYIGYLPGNAFENGGVYRYVIVDPVDHPTVKLLDLRISNSVREVQLKVNQYFKDKGSLPIKDMEDAKSASIDYEKLKMKPVYVQSPFSNQMIPLLLTIKGEVIVDYRLDIGIAVQKGATFTGEDYREILVQNSYFVPNKSLAYEWVNGEPRIKK